MTCSAIINTFCIVYSFILYLNGSVPQCHTVAVEVPKTLDTIKITKFVVCFSVHFNVVQFWLQQYVNKYNCTVNRCKPAFEQLSFMLLLSFDTERLIVPGRIHTF